MSAKWLLVICGGGEKADISPDPESETETSEHSLHSTRRTRSLACPHADHNAQIDNEVLPFGDERFV